MYMVPDSEWTYRRRKYPNNRQRQRMTKNRFILEEANDTTNLLKKFLIGLKTDSNAVKIRMVQIMQRIQTLESLTSDIIKNEKNKKPDDLKAVKYRETHRKAKSKEMEARINSLEEWLKETNIRLNSSEEKGEALMNELNKLNSETQMMKLACVEIIHHELSKAGVLFDDYGTPLPREVHQGKGDSKVRKANKRVKKFT